MQGTQQPDIPFDVGLISDLDGRDRGPCANIDMVDTQGKAGVLDQLIEFILKDDAWIAVPDMNAARTVAIMAGVECRLNLCRVFLRSFSISAARLWMRSISVKGSMSSSLKSRGRVSSARPANSVRLTLC